MCGCCSLCGWGQNLATEKFLFCFGCRFQVAAYLGRLVYAAGIGETTLETSYPPGWNISDSSFAPNVSVLFMTVPFLLSDIIIITEEFTFRYTTDVYNVNKGSMGTQRRRGSANMSILIDSAGITSFSNRARRSINQSRLSCDHFVITHNNSVLSFYGAIDLIFSPIAEFAGVDQVPLQPLWL